MSCLYSCLGLLAMKIIIAFLFLSALHPEAKLPTPLRYLIKVKILPFLIPGLYCSLLSLRCGWPL